MTNVANFALFVVISLPQKLWSLFFDKHQVRTLLLLSVGPDFSGEGEGGELLHLPRVFHFYRS